jgi:hypothetical protein
MWHRVEVVLTDVSEERIASIFRVEIRKSAREASVRDFKSRLLSSLTELKRSTVSDRFRSHCAHSRLYEPTASPFSFQSL